MGNCLAPFLLCHRQGRFGEFAGSVKISHTPDGVKLTRSGAHCRGAGCTVWAQQLSVRLEGGQTLGVKISLCYGTCSEVSEYVVQISYSASAEVDTRRTGNPAIEASSAVPGPRLPHQRTR
jgi:hypothetical protein